MFWLKGMIEIKKRIISVLAAVALIIGCTASVFAELRQFPVELDGIINEYPVVVCPGVASAWLYYGEDYESGQLVWDGINVNSLLPNLEKRMVDIIKAAVNLPFDKAESLAKVLAEEIEHTWEYMACNPDGTSKYDLDVCAFAAEDTTNFALFNSGQHLAVYEQENTKTISNYIGEENVYNFYVDWRMGAEYCAGKLDEYIQLVKEHSGKDKVNIFAVSQGGQMAATYLTLYGYKGDVENAVMSSPAIGGAGIAYDLFNANVHLDEQVLAKMLELNFFIEEDYEWFIKALDIGIIDDLVNAMIPNLIDAMAYWGCLWDLVPTEYYEQLKAMYLTDPACAPLVEKSDRFHYEILPSVTETFRYLNESGKAHISIITGTGSRVISGLDVYSDGIIPVSSATGATCPVFGERFADGYVQINECGGKDKLSPNMQIDASTAYLPDNTWFSDGNFHGWTYWSPCTRTLAIELLLTSYIKDVYTDPRYPQFLTSDHMAYGVNFDFVSDVPGFVDSSCKSLVVKNVCDKATVRITAVYCKQTPITFDLAKPVTLAPGESVTLDIIAGKLPKGKTCIDLTV